MLLKSLKTLKKFKIMYLMAVLELRHQRYIVTHLKISIFSNFVRKNSFFKLRDLIESISISVKSHFLLLYCDFLCFLLFSNISLHCDAFVKSCFPGTKSVHNAGISLFIWCNSFFESYWSICLVYHSSLIKNIP